MKGAKKLMAFSLNNLNSYEKSMRETLHDSDRDYPTCILF